MHPLSRGRGWLHRIVRRIENGEGREGDLELLIDIGDNIDGRTICGLGAAAATPVRSFIKHFREEFEYHIQHKKCLVPGGFGDG